MKTTRFAATLVAALSMVTALPRVVEARVEEEPPPGTYVPGCEACMSSCTIYTSSGTYYTHGSLTNAQKGDALLYKGVGISSMLGLNFLFSHIGIMRHTAGVDHNSASIMALSNSYHVNVGLGSWQQVGNLISSLFNGFYGAANLDGPALYNAMPGVAVVSADGGSQFGSLQAGWRDDLTLLQPIAARRADATRASDWMQSHGAYPYRLFGFMNQNSGASSGGAVCSGTLAVANNASTRTASNAISPHTLSALDTGMAVLNLQGFMWQMIRWDVVSPMAPTILGPGARDDVASGLTDQVINCALYLQPGGCTLMNNAYRNRARLSVGQAPSILYGGYSNATALPLAQAVSPDHVAFTGPQNSEWSAPNRSADARWINKIDAGAWQGGVLVDPTYSGGQWVSWNNTYGACNNNPPVGVY